MTKEIKTIMYKINFMLFLALCLRFSSMLCSAQQTISNSTEYEKEYKSVTDWNCKSIEKGYALVTIIDCLQHWQEVNSSGNLKHIFNYLHKDNHYKNIVGAYHHLLDRHLNKPNDTEVYRYIHQKVCNAVACDFSSCKAYIRNQRERDRKVKDKIDGFDMSLWQCTSCSLKNYSRQQHCQACFKLNDPMNANRDKEFIFLSDLLDTIHAYLVHGCDSGHRYIKDEDYTIKKPSEDRASDHEKDKSDNGADGAGCLLDHQMKTLQTWQASIQQSQRTQDRSKKYYTTMPGKRKAPDGQNISLSLLKAKFGTDNIFQEWITHLLENECDTDCLLEEIEVDDEEEILIAIYKEIFNKTKAYINQKQADQKKEDQKTETYGFDARLYYWDYYKNSNKKNINLHPGIKEKDLYVAPTYLSFKNEILAKGISMNKWDQVMYEAAALLQLSPTLKKIKARGGASRKDGIPLHSGLSFRHILSIIFYTNFTSLCTDFCGSFRYLSHTEKVKSLIKRNSKWHYLAKHLREVVEIFGEEIAVNDDGYVDKGSFYHGTSYVLLNQFSIQSYGPLSTSKQLEVATLFTHREGLVIELKQGIGSFNNALKFFNVSLISCFSAENERLFMGGEYPMQISSIRVLKDNTNTKSLMHALFVVHKMITGEEIISVTTVTPLDIAMCKILFSSSKGFPLYAQEMWKTFKDNPKRLKINMWAMYSDYPSFIPLLCASDLQLKNLLLLDKLVTIFPNTTEIICEATDSISGGYDQEAYASSIVNSNFMLGVKNRLDEVEKNNLSKLEKIIIKTLKYPIQDDCKLYTTQFQTLGWQIAKGAYYISLQKINSVN